MVDDFQLFVCWFGSSGTNMLILISRSVMDTKIHKNSS